RFDKPACAAAAAQRVLGTLPAPASGEDAGGPPGAAASSGLRQPAVPVVDGAPDACLPTGNDGAEIVAGIRFQQAGIETQSQLANIHFHAIVNGEVKLGQHFYASIAIARVAPRGKDCILFVDRQKVSPDDLT